jgi:PTS system fructose-specific IIA component/PTS system nitrogen regulatory IIA component
MDISKFLTRDHVITDQPPGDSRIVLKNLVAQLVELGDIQERSVKTVLDGVLERERDGSTGIARGIAIPHTKTRVVQSPVILFARMSEPIPFDATDGAPVHSLFLVVSPPTDADDHMSILRWVAKLARSDYYATILRNTSDPQSLYELFQEIDAES